jgi:metallo-beta-lactamase family protein
LVENKKIPEVPIFLDSPLAIKVTEIYKKRQKNFKDEAKDLIRSGDKIFDFSGLKVTESSKESEKIHYVEGPKIIIAGAGMSDGGRILRHEKKYLPDPKNMLLFINYHSPGSLGRIIQDGVKEVEINGSKVSIKAGLQTITGYSGHRGSDELLEFVEEAGRSKRLEKVFVAMGEPKSSIFLVQRIKDYLNIDAISPEVGEQFELDF